MTLFGKGYYMWQLPRCEGGVPSAIATRAVEAQLSHVLIKIADGPNWAYNYDYENGIDLIPPVLRELRNAGIQVWGWHYVMGYDPIGEARIAVERTLALGMDGYVIDAEGEYKQSGKKEAAKKFMQGIRSGLPNIPIALSTYRYPKLHSALPFTEFLEKCDYAMPQVYFEQYHNPEEQLERCVEQYMALQPARPVIPTAPTYPAGSWLPTPDEIHRFLQKAKEMNLMAVNAWSWYYARLPKTIDLWQAFADFDWPPEAPVADMPDRLLDRMNQKEPSQIAELYLENAAHVTGARTVLGKAPIQEWYSVLFSSVLPNAQFEMTGKSGIGNSRHFTWKASSDNGLVHNGNDVLGLINGKIQYHYTYFTITK